MATVRRPSSCAVRNTRMAISLRLAAISLRTRRPGPARVPSSAINAPRVVAEFARMPAAFSAARRILANAASAHPDKSYDKRETSLQRFEGQVVKRTPWIVAIVLVAVIAAGLAFFWPVGGDGDVLRFPGTVEIQEVRLGSKI